MSYSKSTDNLQRRNAMFEPEIQEGKTKVYNEKDQQVFPSEHSNILY